MKKVTVIGGGTGTFVVLSGLKKYPLDLGVIVTMMDSGGSTGKLRDQLGVLPPGDFRQCLVALSEAPMLWRKLFLYRFENGDFAGHNFGNIFLSALEKVSKNYNEVIKTASYVLKTKGPVIPVTFDKVHLCVEYENGNIVKEEGNIDKNYEEKSRVKKAYLEPDAAANPEAQKRIEESDYVIIGPGDIYTTIVPALLTKGIKNAIKKSRAKIIYILNLMTKSGQTTNYTAGDHLADINYYLGCSPDIIIINNGKIASSIIKWYEKEHEHAVEDDLTKTIFSGKLIKKDVVDGRTFTKSKADKFVNPLVRSIVRHNPQKLAKILMDIIL